MEKASREDSDMDEALFMWRDMVTRRRITLGSEVEVKVLTSNVTEGRVEVLPAEL